MSGKTSAIVSVFLYASRRAEGFGSKFKSSMACITRCLVVGATLRLPARVRETVAIETPACSATVYTVAFFLFIGRQCKGLHYCRAFHFICQAIKLFSLETMLLITNRLLNYIIFLDRRNIFFYLNYNL